MISPSQLQRISERIFTNTCTKLILCSISVTLCCFPSWISIAVSLILSWNLKRKRNYLTWKVHIFKWRNLLSNRLRRNTHLLGNNCTRELLILIEYAIILLKEILSWGRIRRGGKNWIANNRCLINSMKVYLCTSKSVNNRKNGLNNSKIWWN